MTEMQKKFCGRAKIVRKQEVADELFEFEVACPQIASTAMPGQFIQVRAADVNSPLLRRPFSIAGVEDENLVLLIKRVGQGTALICEKKTGEELDLIGPLGQGFPTMVENKNYLLVAGGYGIAPFRFFTTRHSSAGGRILYGARTKREINFFDEHLSMMGCSGWEVVYCTEDGTLGRKCLVTGLLEEELEIESGYEAVYACGPLAMLKEVVRIADKHKLPCWVSMETHMGCGFGVCRGCAIPVKTGAKSAYKHACLDGPVFRADEIDWDKLP